MIRVNIKKLKDSVKTPAYATEGSAAVDLRAANDSPIVIEAGEIAKIPTGIAIALPDNNAVAVVCARSGLATKFGISLANGIGVIDSDYRGELIVALINNGKKMQKLLGYRGRLKNAKKAFVLGQNATDIHGKRVILFDDITTTGASATACIKLLRDAGAVGVDFVSFARTER